MPESHAVRALKRKRAELGAELTQIECLRKSLLRRIKHVDATLSIMGGEQLAPIPHGRKRRWLFRRGELQRMVGAIIREAGGAIETRDIARAIIARMDWDASDAELVALIAGKVRDVRKRVAQAGRIG